MSELTIDQSLIGREVVCAGRPDWGPGKVLAVQATTRNGSAVQRVTVHFRSGTKTVVIPPARLLAPSAEPERTAGWLEGLAGNALDERLARLPSDVVQVLGTPMQRLSAVAPLYAFDESPAAVLKWARGQTGLGDPLSHWTRDELLVAFQKFCGERDAHLRAMAALVRMQEGADRVEAWLASLNELSAGRARAALARII